MKQLIKTLVSSLAVMAIMIAASVAVGNQPVNAAALDCTKAPDDATAACKLQSGANKVGGTSNTTDLPTFITNIVNVLLFIAGAIAVVMIIFGAIRYITSNGDQANVKAAKETIMYAVVGLIVAMLAFAIVNFIVSKL